MLQCTVPGLDKWNHLSFEQIKCLFGDNNFAYCLIS